MNTTATRVQDIPPYTHREAMDVAAAEYDRLLDVLRSLSPGDWSRPTECALWDVRTMVSHVLGATESHSSIREQMHQTRAYRKATSGPMIDAMTALQVRDRAHLSPSELITRFEPAAPRSVKARRRMPGLMRAVRMKVDAPFDKERWKLGYLMDVIFTRDTWMHRVDISRATGRTPVLTPGHDGRLVADVVAEWARRHGQPFSLTLAGPAGGSYVAGTMRTSGPQGGAGYPGPELELDAVEFCRTVSGRTEGAGLLSTPVPF